MIIEYRQQILSSDQDIIKACVDGNRQAQEWIYNEFKGQLMAICRRYCNSHDQAKDVLQESFIKIFSNIKNYNGSGSLAGWMCRIVINTAITDNLKWDNRREEFDIQKFDQSETSHLMENLNMKELLNLIERLPTGCKYVFNMYVIDGFTHAEIADKLKISIGTSKSQLSRAKSLLVNFIQDLETTKTTNIPNE